MIRSNERVAGALDELADLLAITGGDPYRVRAYEKAARSVDLYPIDVDGLDEKGLRSIPAVGSHIAGRIVQLRETGHLDELDELRAQVPAGLRTMLSVPGLGPKKAHQVYEELHIASVPELLDALKHEGLRTLRGWGPTSEARLLEAIKQYQAAGGRMQLGVATELAQDLVASLRTARPHDTVVFAGSLRRMCETIGDLDLLVASEEPGEVMEAFAAAEDVAEVPVRGPTRATAVTTGGVHVDLRVVQPAVFGAALVYFTGSKAHGIHLRRIARRAGLKLSEYGLERTDDGKLLASRTEEQVYAALGMGFVPPALREDRGEIEAALAGTLPHLVDLRDLRGDLHTHTDLTDGTASLEDMVAAARARRYRYLGVTDHGPSLPMQRMTAEKALAQRAAVRRLERDGAMTILHGSELSIAPDGSLDWDDEFLDGFDLLVASIHSAFSMSREQMTARLIKAIEHPAVNIIGHPTARSIGHRAAVDFDPEEVFRAAARAGTALEINSFPDRLDLNDQLARLAAEQGVVFAISSDAHAIGHLDQLCYGVGTAQRAWIGPERVINTWPLGRLQRFLAKGRSRSPR
jgi:DNA polymerase (family X)